MRTTFNFLTKRNYAFPNLLTLNLFGLVDNISKSKWAFFSENINENDLEEFQSQMGSESFRAFLDMLFPNIKINFHTKIPMLVIGAEKDNIFTVKENQLRMI
jgi:hypothetical protein